MSEKYHHADRFLALGPFLLVSVLLHGFLLIGYDKWRGTATKLPTPVPLSIRLGPLPAIPQPARAKDIEPKAPPSAGPQHKTDHETAQKPGTDAWQQGMESLQKIMQAPGFFEQFKDQDSVIPNYRPDLFDSAPQVTELTIDTYRRLQNGELDIVFRYPSGKKICVRAREPNPMDPFDFGSWEVLVAGCH